MLILKHIIKLTLIATTACGLSQQPETQSKLAEDNKKQPQPQPALTASKDKETKPYLTAEDLLGPGSS